MTRHWRDMFTIPHWSTQLVTWKGNLKDSLFAILPHYLRLRLVQLMLTLELVPVDATPPPHLPLPSTLCFYVRVHLHQCIQWVTVREIRYIVDYL